MQKENKRATYGIRSLKVHSKVYFRLYSKWVDYPEIRLAGKWLKDSGFEVGSRVTIIQEKSKLTILVDNTKFKPQ